MFDVAALEKLADSLGGLLLLGVLPNTPAARAGLRFGDVLLEVNGERVRSWADFIRAKSSSRGATEVVVFRSGKMAKHRFVHVAASEKPDYLSIVVQLSEQRFVAGRSDAPNPKTLS